MHPPLKLHFCNQSASVLSIFMYSMNFFFLCKILNILYILYLIFFFWSIIIDIAYTIVCYICIIFYFSHTFEVTSYAHV